MLFLCVSDQCSHLLSTQIQIKISVSYNIIKKTVINLSCYNTTSIIINSEIDRDTIYMYKPVCRCQDKARNRLVASTTRWIDDGANAWPPRCIAAGYSPDKGKIEFASLANIKTVLNNSIAD